MALGAALVDRARPVTQEAAGKVRGASRFVAVRGEWFKCRLTLPAAPEVVEAQTFRRKSVLVPTLLYKTLDSTGAPIELGVESRIEVDSKQLGTTVWDVVSEPEPLRKKRRVIGYQVTLQRVLDEQLPDAAVV